MRIGEVATRARVSAATVRYYERRGLIPAPPRSAAGYRRFGPETVDRIRFIKHAQRLGFVLEEIRELLALRVEDAAPCEAVQARAEKKAAEIERKIRELQRMKQVLDELVASCEARRPTRECPILEVLDEEQTG